MANRFTGIFHSRPQTYAAFERPGQILFLSFLITKAPVQESRDPFERYGSEIESIYLTGDFAVKADISAKPSEPSQHNVRGFLVPKPVHHFTSFTMTREKSLFTGDLVTQGYPFYNGSFRLEKNFDIGAIEKEKKYILKFPLSEAIIIKVILMVKNCRQWHGHHGKLILRML